MVVPNVIEAFSEDQAERLTGLTHRQLRYWERTDVFVPTYVDEDTSSSGSRVYFFRDIAALRTLAALRTKYNVSLQHLRKAAARMKELEIDLWRGTRLWVQNRRVIFEEPGTGKPQDITTKQYVIPLDLGVVVGDTRSAITRLRRRPASKVGQVERTRGVNGNHPVVAGTRVRVASIQRLAEDGYDVAAIRAEFPGLTDKDVEAALAFVGAYAA